MEILAIIPARGGSKGIPLKNLVKLRKKPLIEYTIKQAKSSKLITKIVISTDNQKIAKIGKKLGAEIIIRPKTGNLSESLIYCIAFSFITIYNIVNLAGSRNLEGDTKLHKSRKYIAVCFQNIQKHCQRPTS